MTQQTKCNLEKLNVGVLMGGRNTENEVSFNSGRTICDHLDSERFNIIPIFQTFTGELYILPYHFLHRGKIKDFEHRLNQEAQKICWDDLKKIIDFAYLAMHGRNSEDGTLQGMLEVLQIPYLGSKVFASAVCMDKIIQRKFLQANNINIPKGVSVLVDQILDLEKQIDAIWQELKKINLSLPLIVKPHKEGSSLGITVVRKQADLFAAIITASQIHPGIVQPVIIEEYIAGMEFSCVILEDEQGNPLALPPTEIELEKNSDIFDYTQKYMPGRATKPTPARCSTTDLELIQKTCCRVKEILKIDTIARIDGFLTPDHKIYIIDPNSLSGMGPTTFIFLQAAEQKISHTELINHLIDTDLKRYGMNLNLNIKKKTSMENKIKVGILLGGASNEREVSLESGRNIIYKLSPQKYEPIPLFVNEKQEIFQISQKLLVRNSTKEISQELDPSTKVLWSNLPKIADFIFISLHGGIGENGSVQGALEALDLPYNGSGVFASALCMDKYKTNQLLDSYGFNTPKNYLVNKANWLDNQDLEISKITNQLSYPLIIKPHDDGCSVMVALAKNETNLINCIEKIFNTNKDFALVEEKIIGMELTVGVIGNDHPTALPPSQTVSNHDVLSLEEKFLPGAGENQTPALLPKATLSFVQNEIEKVFKAAQCQGYARIDCFYQNDVVSPTGKERVVIIEINTLPATTPATCIFHQAAELGIKPMDFIDQIITLGFEAHQRAKISPSKKLEATKTSNI
jgi:D-alanine--D-alanine ligase